MDDDEEAVAGVFDVYLTHTLSKDMALLSFPTRDGLDAEDSRSLNQAVCWWP